MTTVRALVLTALMILTGTAAWAKSDVRTVPFVDVNKFTGTWYEIASLPMFFQRDCVATNATYTLKANGELDVLNKCNYKTLDGELKTIHGKAWITDKTSNAKLKVQFFWPISAEYWVIDLDPNYQYVVTATPNRDYLWILSRTRTMDPKVYDQLVANAKAQGYDVSKLNKTLQPTN